MFKHCPQISKQGVLQGHHVVLPGMVYSQECANTVKYNNTMVALNMNRLVSKSIHIALHIVLTL